MYASQHKSTCYCKLRKDSCRHIGDYSTQAGWRLAATLCTGTQLSPSVGSGCYQEKKSWRGAPFNRALCEWDRDAACSFRIAGSFVTDLDPQSRQPPIVPAQLKLL
jgi:hypothetical protein